MMRPTLINYTLLAGTVSAVSPIEKVIELLQEMTQKAEVEKQDEAVQFAAFDSWCSGSDKNSANVIADLQAKIEAAESHMFKQENAAKKLATRIAKESKTKSDAESDMKKIRGMRTHESNDFKATSTDLIESVEALHRAIEHVKVNMKEVTKEVALVQLEKVLTPLAHSALIQLSQEPPQATEMSYESQSGGILEMLENLNDKFQSELDELSATETSRRQSYQVMIQQLTDYTENAKAVIDRSTILKGEAETKYGQAKGDRAAYAGQVETETAEKNDIMARCTDKRNDYPVRQQTRAEEILAVNKAIETMSGNAVSTGSDHLDRLAGDRVNPEAELAGTSFMQMTSHLKDSLSSDTREKLANLFRSSGIKSLISIAGTVESGESRFAKITQLVKDMVFQLQEQAKKEAAKQGYCVKELGTNKIARDSKTEDVEKYSLRKEELSATIGMLKDEVADLMDQITTDQSELQTAREQRFAEKESNEATIADAKASLEAVQSAMEVVREFYDNAASATAFVQKKATTKQDPSEPAVFGDEPYTGMQGSQGGVVGILEVISADFSRLEAETTASESKAASEHDAFVQGSKVNIAKSETVAGQKKRDILSNESDLADTEGDLSAASEGLDAANEVYESLKPTCVDEGVSHEERMAKRAKEIEDLGTALEILKQSN